MLTCKKKLYYKFPYNNKTTSIQAILNVLNLRTYLWSIRSKHSRKFFTVKRTNWFFSFKHTLQRFPMNESLTISWRFFNIQNRCDILQGPDVLQIPMAIWKDFFIPQHAEVGSLFQLIVGKRFQCESCHIRISYKDHQLPLIWSNCFKIRSFTKINSWPFCVSAVLFSTFEIDFEWRSMCSCQK